jgi:methyl-accepting chemotaxis protein
MRFRSTRLQVKITALLMSLIALWAFAAWVTLREGLNLLSLSTLDKNTGRPGSALVTELQQERRVSVIYLSNPTAPQRQVLDAQRSHTNTVASRFRELAGSDAVKRAASALGDKRILESFRQLDGLREHRAAIDAGRLDRAQTIIALDGIIDAIFRIWASNATLDDEDIARDSRTLIALTRAREILSREDALLAGVLAAGRFTAVERAQFVELVGAQRLLHDEAAAELSGADRARYDQFVKGPTFGRFRVLEDRVIQRARVGASPVAAGEWESAIQPTLTKLDGLVQAGGDDLVKRARPVGLGVIVRLALAGGLGLIAVIASIIVSITTSRALFRQLERLRQAALELAERRLPSVVERLGRGEEVDVAAEAPPLAFGADAVGQVSRAFNTVQETAIRSAVEQAELRRGIRDVLLSLARRTQTLVHRQLTLLDRMERREMETAELEDLFRLDHLATRMRRNAENLIVLSGATPARGWRRSVPMMDVVRAAVAEIEDYTRVTVLPMGSVSLAGRAVGDITHLLAELIENAVSFSPPPAVVQVSGHVTARGYAIEIEDRGLGIAEERLEAINARISDPPEFNMSRSVQLGLYVVGRLSQRYGMRVTLKNSAYGGTTAVVLVPGDLLIDDPEIDAGAPARAVPEPVGAAAVSTRRRAAIGSGGDGPAPAMADGSSGAPVGPGSGGAAVTARAEARRGISTQRRAGTAAGPRPELPMRTPAKARAEPPTTEPPMTQPRPDVGTGTSAAARSDGPSDTMPLTPAGLPFRIPQASLNPALRDGNYASAEGAMAGEAAAAAPGPADDVRRSPEEVRKLVGSYLSGTFRGRSEAARARQATTDPSATTPRADEAEHAGHEDDESPQ